MKIAFFHELHAGGARRSVVEFAKHLIKRHMVDLYYVDEVPNEKETLHFSAVHFYPFREKKWSGKNWQARLYKDTIELYKLFALHRKIAREIDKKKYDAVFVEPSRFTQAPFILRFLRTKTVYYCQEPLRMVYEVFLDSTSRLGTIRRVYERVNRGVRKAIDAINIHSADVVLANSKFTRKNIKFAYGLTSEVCYMGIDPHVFVPIHVEKDIDVLFVGAYEQVDGYDLLDRALRNINEPLAVKVLASEREWISNDRMLATLYSRSKIAVCLAYNEPFGLIPLEAMSCGTPVIAVKEGGYKETVIDNKIGYLVKRDPEELRKRILTLLSQPEKLTSMSKACREDVCDHWVWGKGAGKIESILSRVAESMG